LYYDQENRGNHRMNKEERRGKEEALKNLKEEICSID
jgi:hypothetical protein